MTRRNSTPLRQNQLISKARPRQARDAYSTLSSFGASLCAEPVPPGWVVQNCVQLRLQCLLALGVGWSSDKVLRFTPGERAYQRHLVTNSPTVTPTSKTGQILRWRCCFFVGHVTVAHFVATGAPPQGAGRSVVAQLQGGGAGGGDGGNKRPSKTSTPRRAQQSSTNTPPKVRAFVRPPFCQTAIDDLGIILSISVCKHDLSPQIAL